MQQQCPGGWREVMERNRVFTCVARTYLINTLNWQPTAPASMVGSMAAFEMPDAETSDETASPLYADPLQDKLWGEYKVEVPIIPWPAPPKRLLRISAQLYNSPEDYFKLVATLRAVLLS
jgi:isopenicillin-N epimerase